MKIGKGVEWAVHTCALLAVLPPEGALSREALAEFLDVPQAYLAKQLQALSRAGVVTAQPGVAGGYRLAREPATVTLWDITAAVEGTAPLFRCTEVRRNGPCGASPSECLEPCAIAAAFQRAEAVYRQSLADVPLTDLVAGVAQAATAARKQSMGEWIRKHATVRE